MARTIIFKWNESDADIIAFYKDNITKEKPSGVANLTDSEDYRLKATRGEVGGTLDFSLTAELSEDIELDISSEFSNPSDTLPDLSAIAKPANLISGTATPLLNIFTLPTWDKTNPITLPVKVILYTKRNAILDVLLPMWSLTSMTILKFNAENNSYKTPGIYLGNMQQALARPQTTQTQGSEVGTEGKKDPIKRLADPAAQAGFLNVKIPGIITFTGLLKSCKPTISRQPTESGGPLWATLDMTIQGTIPASSIELFSALSSSESFSTVEGGGTGATSVFN